MSDEQRTVRLKTVPSYFMQVAKGVKNFELRKNDRNFKVGDLVILDEWDGEDYTGLHFGPLEITYVLPGGIFGLPKDLCIFCWEVVEGITP